MDNGDTGDNDFTQWLSRNKLDSYKSALVAEGYEMIESLTLMTADEISELSEAIQMRPGHRRIFPVAIKKAREELQEKEAKDKRDKTREEKEKEAKRKRDKTREEKRDKAKQKREEEEQEEIHNMEKRKRKMEDELAKIEMSRKLEQARQKRAVSSSVVAAQQEVENKEGSMAHDTKALPSDKLHHAFISHKKKHTAFGDHYEMLSIRLKDMLKWRGFSAFMDCDDLNTISQESLEEGVVKSCCVLVVLNDETLSSDWCRLEVDCAQRNNIPIVCVVDCDKQILRSVVDGYLESDDSFLFDEQVISVTSQGREHSYTVIIEAIKRAVQAAFKRKQTALTPAPTSEVQESQLGRVHDEQDDTLQTELMAALHSKFSTSKVAFDTFSNEAGIVGKKEWRRVLKRTLPTLSRVDAKKLRKKLPKKVSLMQFRKMMGEVKSTSSRPSASKSTSNVPSNLAELPGEVPVLPTSFQSRPHAHEQLVAALLSSGGSHSTAVTAPKSRVSSQGMGGVGKTMLTAACVRDERVRGAFESIAWIGMSQQPDLLQLQRLLYLQLHPQHGEMPKRDLEEAQRIDLTKLVLNRTVLVCLDDIWDSSHEASFACIDTSTASRQLITTRIKGLLQGAAEVELELLGLQESVELLAGVACLDGSEISPVCLEIAQLCGRLPLCLSIVGNLIRTFGAGWEQEVPSILRKDMRSLTEAGSGSSKEHTPLNLQQRVIQSGLDSISGTDAEGVVSLFKAMAVFAEDQVVPVGVLSAVWVSIDPKDHKPLSAMKVRAWVSQLLSRSILLGSSSDGVSMHDIIRDYTLAAHNPTELQQRQRCFCECLIDIATNGEESTATVSIRTYATTLLHFHIRGAAITPLSNDALVQSWLLLFEQQPDIADQALRGVGSSETNDLAIWFRDKHDYWSTVRLWKMLVFSTNVAASKSQYCRSIVAVLAQIPAGTQPGAVDLEVQTLQTLSMFSDREDERDSSIERLFELADDASKMQELVPYTRAKVFSAVGLALFGFSNNSYCTTRLLNQIRRGASFFIRSGSCWVDHAKSKSGLMNWVCLGIAFDPMCLQTLCYTCLRDMHDHAVAMLGEGGVELVNWHGAYDFSYHERVVAMVNDFFCMGHAFHILDRFGDVQTAVRIANEWEAVNQQVHVIEAYHKLALQRLQQAAQLQRALAVIDMRWYNVQTKIEENSKSKWAWTREDEGQTIFFASSGANVLVFQLLMLAKLPSSVQKSEAAYYVEELSDVPYFRDLYFEILGLYMSPYTLGAQAVQNLGLGQLAVQYAHSALTFHKNPVKTFYAHVKLGEMLRGVDKK